MSQENGNDDADDFAIGPPDRNLPAWLANRRREREAWYRLIEATVTGKIVVGGAPMEATQSNLCLGLKISHPTVLRYQRCPEFEKAVKTEVKRLSMLDRLNRARGRASASEKFLKVLDRDFADPSRDDVNDLAVIDKRFEDKTRDTDETGMDSPWQIIADCVKAGFEALTAKERKSEIDALPDSTVTGDEDDEENKTDDGKE